MTNKLTPRALAIIRKMQQSELTESVIYEKIARFAKGEENQRTLQRLAREEHAHYEIWKRYTGEEMKPERGKVFWYTLMARILGFGSHARCVGVFCYFHARDLSVLIDSYHSGEHAAV